MDKRQLTDGPWMAFPCRCTHGCGPFYSPAQIFATPCQIGPDGFPGHHDFRFPQAIVTG